MDVLTSEEETFLQKALQENMLAGILLDDLERILLESDSFEDFLQNIEEDDEITRLRRALRGVVSSEYSGNQGRSLKTVFPKIFHLGKKPVPLIKALCVCLSSFANNKDRSSGAIHGPYSGSYKVPYTSK